MRIRHYIPTLLVALLAVTVMIPFLGLTEFYSKGEPREAVVAVSILNTDNWILPVNNGGDIPYKPPFFHYCIALLSLVAGHVSEYTSRLPSALSLIMMTMAFFCFVRRRKDTTTGVVTSLLILTAFEVHRAGVACRVDMMLTMFITLALLLMYRWMERGGRGLPLWAIVCMSGGVLTKGPVGALLPCMVTGVFMLMRGKRFLNVSAKMMACGLLSCIVPALWYVAAYGEGGQRFLDLVIEENFGRMTGTMSYESHKHPFTYNFLTMITGWLPYTLLFLMSLFGISWKRYMHKPDMRSIREKVLGGDDFHTFVWLSAVLIFVFYCLPSSKRSVYLLPCYPFMAILIAEWMTGQLNNGSRKTLRIYAAVMGVTGVAITTLFMAIRMEWVPESVFPGKHADENVALMRALRDTTLNPTETLLSWLPFVLGLAAIAVVIRKKWHANRHAMLTAVFAPVFAIFLALDGVLQPVILNKKSLRPMAEMIRQVFPDDKLYSYISVPMMHFFGANFYLGDRIGQFERPRYSIANSHTTPDNGLLLIPEGDVDEFIARYDKRYKFVLVLRSLGRTSEMKDRVCFYRFTRLSTK